MTSRESEGPRARAYARLRTTRPPMWQPWQLHFMRTAFEAWNADVRRSIDAYDTERQLEADADEERHRRRLAYERKLRTRKREHLRELNGARGG